MKVFYRQPHVRLVLLAAGMMLFLWLQSTVVRPYLNLTIFFVLIGVMVWAVVKPTYHLGMSLRMPAVRFTVRQFRKMRKELMVPPAIQLLYALAWIASMATTVVLLLKGSPASAAIASLLVFSLAIAAFFDVSIRILRLLKKAWAMAIGKIIMANLGVVALLLALALAKQQLHALVRVDPKYFDDFARLLAVVYLPFVYLAIGMAVLFLFFIFQMAGLMIALAASFVVRAFSPLLEASKLREDCRIFWYRMRHGKKPVESVKKTLMPLSEIRFFMRPLGTAALVVAISQLISNSAAYLPQTQRLVASALMMTQYQSDSRCIGLAPGTRVVYLDRGNVSTAAMVGDHIVFGVEQCKTDLVYKDPPQPDIVER